MGSVRSGRPPREVELLDLKLGSKKKRDARLESDKEAKSAIDAVGLVFGLIDQVSRSRDRLAYELVG